MPNFGKRLVNESLSVYFCHDTISMNLTLIQEELVYRHLEFYTIISFQKKAPTLRNIRLRHTGKELKLHFILLLVFSDWKCRKISYTFRCIRIGKLTALTFCVKSWWSFINYFLLIVFWVGKRDGGKHIVLPRSTGLCCCLRYVRACLKPGKFTTELERTNYVGKN